MKAGYVRNIERDPRVRMKLREGLKYHWHTGTKHVSIQIEADHNKLTALVAELNRLLDGDQNTREITPVRDVTGTGPSVNPAARTEET
jgi:hypothetical protein